MGSINQSLFDGVFKGLLKPIPFLPNNNKLFGFIPYTSKKKSNKNFTNKKITETAVNSYINTFISQATELGNFGYPNRSKILDKEGFTTAENYLRDAEVQAGLKTLVNSVLLKTIKILPSEKAKTAKEKRNAQQLVNFIEFVESEIQGTFKDILHELAIVGIWFGYSLSEKVYKFVDDGEFKNKLIFDSIKNKRSGLFGFVINEFDDILAVENYANGIQQYDNRYIPIEKFVKLTWSRTYNNHYGNALFDNVYKLIFAKNELYKQMLIATSKYAMGSLAVKIDNMNDSETLNKAIEIAENLQTGAGVVVPNDFIIEYYNDGNKGDNPYTPILQWLDGQISLAITGQTLSNNESQGTGTYAQSKVHLNISTLHTIYLQGLLQEIFNEQIIRPLIELNFDKENYPIKIYPIIKFEEVVESSKKEFIDNIKTLSDINFIDSNNINHVNHVLKLMDLPLVTDEEFKNSLVSKKNNINNNAKSKEVVNNNG